MNHIRSLLERKPRLLRFIRYGATSIVASAVSFGTIALTLDVLGADSVVATVAGFCTGAFVAFVMNRLWAWQLRDSAGMGQDFFRYWVVSIVTFLIALGCTTVANTYAHGLDNLMRTLVIEGAYFGSYAVTFVAKFVLLDRFVFGAASRASRSRAQVENTTRA
jgi:putative flippase GtrA